jgi:hypothetical protein
MAKAPPMGKTTIAYTICKLLDKMCPFASFCSRQLDSRNSKLLVTTLCHDFAELYSSYAANVLSILEINPRLATLACASKWMNWWSSHGKPLLLRQQNAIYS